MSVITDLIKAWKEGTIGGEGPSPEYIDPAEIDFQGTWEAPASEPRYGWILCKYGPLCSVAGLMTGTAMADNGINAAILLPESWREAGVAVSPVLLDATKDVVGAATVDGGDGHLYIIATTAIQDTDVLIVNHRWAVQVL